MNEVALHRGRHPHMTVIDAFVNGQHLTEAIVRCPSALTKAARCENHLAEPLLCGLPTTVRWPDHRDTYRLYRLLPLCWRSYRAPFGSISGAHAHLPTLSELPHGAAS